MPGNENVCVCDFQVYYSNQIYTKYILSKGKYKLVYIELKSLKKKTCHLVYNKAIYLLCPTRNSVFLFFVFFFLIVKHFYFKK